MAPAGAILLPPEDDYNTRKAEDPKSATLSNSQLPATTANRMPWQRGEVAFFLRFFGLGVTNVSRVVGLSEKRSRLLKTNGTEPHTYVPSPHRAETLGGMPGEPEMENHIADCVIISERTPTSEKPNGEFGCVGVTTKNTNLQENRIREFLVWLFKVSSNLQHISPQASLLDGS